MSYSQTWYISVVFIVVAAALHLWNAVKMKHAAAVLSGVIRNRQDLDVVRGAINLSMMLAIAYLALYGAMIALLVYLVLAQGMAVSTAATHLLVFAVVTLPLGIITRGFEARIRSLEVNSDGPEIAETYLRWLVQWRQARLKLPD